MLRNKYCVITYSVICIVLWIFISINIDVFGTSDGFEWFSCIMSYVCVALVGICGGYDFEFSHRTRKIIAVFMIFLVPFFDMQISLIFSGIPEFSIFIYLINVLFYAVITAIVFAISGSIRISGITSVTIAYLFNLSSYVVKVMRGTPLVPGDMLAIGTAAQVAGNYSFEISYEFVYATVVLVLVISLIVFYSERLDFKVRQRIIASVTSAVFSAAFVVVMFNIDATNLYIDTFDQIHANNTYGVAYSFFINYRKMELVKPDNYLARYVEEELLAETDDSLPPENMPDVIAIMNESFSDLNINNSLDTDISYMPFYNSLNKNVIKGQLLVTPFGGGTCNTEYEFLTGMSMATLPSGSMPYLQYIRQDYPMSVVKHFSKLGYKTVAFHPFAKQAWNRDKVYDYLGFDSYVSEENMDSYLDRENYRYIRNYLSDETDYEILENILNSKNPDEKMFIFNITIQNHGGYNFDEEDYEKVHITNMKGENPEAEQYLSLIKESDKAFEQLIKRFEKSDEPVVILMFGDHQPGLETAFYSELLGSSPETMQTEDLQKRYIVPFVIWANYDIEGAHDVFTSPQYLSNYLLKAAGLPYSRVNMFLEKTQTEIKAINDMGYYDKYDIWKENNVGENEALKAYEDVNYYMLMQKNKSLEN